MQSAMTNVVRPLAALATALALPSAAWIHGDLTVTSWGGANTRSQMLAYVIPYEQQTGLTINMERYDGGRCPRPGRGLQRQMGRGRSRTGRRDPRLRGRPAG